MTPTARNANARRQPGGGDEAKTTGRRDSNANDGARRKFIDAGLIRLDGSTQPRCAINEDTVADYAEAMRDGASFPAVVVFNDGAALWLADGFHRFHATRAAGMPTILVEEHPGTRRDAILYGFGANVRHGLRETRADKRRKVEAMLRDDEWVMWSDREIARRCGVHHETVGSVRAELVGRGEIRHVDTRTDSAGRQQPAAKATASSEIPTVEVRTVDRAGALYLQATPTADDAWAANDDAPPVPEDEPAPVPPVESEPASPLQAEPIEAPAPASAGPTPFPPSAPAPAADGEAERLRAENAELREHLDELASNLEEVIGENETLHRITDADDQVKAALAEVRRVAEHNRILEERIRGLTREKAEAIRMAKSYKRRAEAAEKQLAARG